MAAEAKHEILTVCNPMLIVRARRASESELVMVGGKRGRTVWVWPAGRQDVPVFELGEQGTEREES